MGLWTRWLWLAVALLSSARGAQAAAAKATQGAKGRSVAASTVPSQTLRAVSIWDSPVFAGEAGPRAADFQEAFARRRAMGAFEAGEIGGALWFSNGVIEVGLRRDGTALWLASLRDARRGIELLCGQEARRPLWALVLRDPSSGKTSVFDAFAAGKPAIATTLDPKSGWLALTAKWPPSRPDGQPGGTIAVEVSARLAPEEPFTRWRIDVENHLARRSLWRVDFPIIPGPGRAGRSDVFHKSFLYRAHDGEIHDHLFNVQFLSVGSLYLGAHDPAHASKEFALRTGREFRQQVLVPDAFTTGVSYRQPYDFVMGTSGGDWFDSARLYRQWAQKQPWFGPLTQDRATSQTPAGKATAWITAMHPLTQDPAAVVREAMRFRDAVGAPIGIHWYNWSFKPFAPRLFPAKKGFAQAAHEAEAAGIPVMPYVSALYWNKWWGQGEERQLWPEFEHARPYACGAVPGEWEPSPDEDPVRVEEGHYLIQVKQQGAVPMCRDTEFWPACLSAQIKRLHEESGCSAVYLDMVATAARWPCFNSAHGHPAGGGDHWAKGNDRLLAAIRGAVGPKVLISGEGRYEGHIPFIDMDLMGGNETECAVPVYEAVYGARRTAFFRIMPEDDAPALIALLGMHWLQGQRPRVGEPLLGPELAGALSFLGRLCRMRARAGEFFDNGELLRAPAWAKAPSRLRLEHWKRDKNSALAAIELPALERSAWRLPDGRIGVFIANMAAQPEEAALDLASLQSETRQAKSAGTAPAASRPVGPGHAAKILDSEGKTTEAGTAAALAIQVPAHDIRLCIIPPK